MKFENQNDVVSCGLSRRGFIVGTGAAVVTSALGEGAEKPLWTAGIITDTHLRGRTTESYRRIEWAAKFFREKRVNAFFHCGDIAAYYDQEAYEFIRQVFDREFAPNGIREFFVYHNHDRMGPRSKEDPAVVFADVRKYLKCNDLYVSTVVGGTPVILLPFRWENTPAKAEALLAEAERKFPQGPILVFDHMPPPHSVANSGVWGGPEMHRPFYRRHPRVIQVNGHTHSSIQSESEIYQDDDVTAVNAGCLTTWVGETVGFNPAWKTNYGVMVMEVYSSRIVFRRYDLRDGSEFHPEAPWTIRWDAAQNRPARTYDRAKQAATAPKAAFPLGATLKLTPGKDGDFNLVIPTSTTYRTGDGYLYRIEVLDGSGRVVARRDQDGVYYLPEKDRPATITHLLPMSLFRGVAKPKIRVTPVNFYSADGVALELAPTAFDVSVAEAAKPVWSGEGPFKLEGDRYVLPPEATAHSKRRQRLRFTLDIESVQEDRTSLSIDMRVAVDHRQLRPWLLMALAPGRPGVLRYVFDVFPDKDGCLFEVKCGGLRKGREIKLLRVAVD